MKTFSKFKGVCTLWDKGYGYIMKTHGYDEESRKYIETNKPESVFCYFGDVIGDSKRLRKNDIVTFQLAKNLYQGQDRGKKAVNVKRIG